MGSAALEPDSALFGFVFSPMSCIFPPFYYRLAYRLACSIPNEGKKYIMIADERLYERNGLAYSIRSARPGDAAQLSEVRLTIDGETEYMDRERGEALIDAAGFERLIHSDSESPCNLFLVAVSAGRIAGFARCEGSSLKRLSHKAEVGICVLREFWGCGMGGALLKRAMDWADHSGIRKLQLSVLETNHKAIRLYRRNGFEIEGVLKQDKRLSDGRYYDTIVMGRFKP